MKEVVVNINKVNLYSLPCIIIGTPLFIIVYKYFHGTGLREILDSNPYLLMVLVLVIFGMVILHELIHGVFFSLYAKRGTKSKENLNRGFKTKGISDATMKKIKTASRVLSYASEPQKVRNSKGEYIKHLCIFITLTLPFEQNHEDKIITKIVLGAFFDKCRKIGILNNYVWRAGCGLIKD